MERKLNILNNAYKSKLERHAYRCGTTHTHTQLHTSVALHTHTHNYIQTIKDAVNTNVVQVHVKASVKHRYMT